MRNAYRFVVLLLLPLPAAAQAPRVEVFTGYSHLVGNLDNSSFNLNGVESSVTENLNQWFGGTLDVSGQFGTEGGFKVNSESIAYGPVVSYRRLGGLVPFAHGMLGAVRASPEYLGVSQSEYRLGVWAGGGVDVRLTDTVSLRVIQADYLMTRFSSTRQDNIRLSAGLVFRFGQTRK
jgi:Outer membrane protein beta-barrel domain